MAITRGILPTDSFTIISNAWLRDRTLSWKSKGLLAYIASHAAGHKLTTEQIITEATDKADAVRSGLVELEQAGYLRRHEVRDGKGHRIGTDFELLDPIGKAPDGEIPTGCDQQEQAVSPGQPQTGFPQAGESDPKKTTPLEKTKKTPSPSVRGTRLPADFLPSDEMKLWARDNAPGIGWSEHEKFVDYWIAQPGQKGVKTDWIATWRNWMRRAAESVRPTSGAGAGRPQQFKIPEQIREERAVEQRTVAQVADQMMEQEPGLSIGEALELAKRYVEQGSLNALSTSAATGYIEVEVIDNGPREVTGS